MQVKHFGCKQTNAMYFIKLYIVDCDSVILAIRRILKQPKEFDYTIYLPITFWRENPSIAPTGILCASGYSVNDPGLGT